MSSQPSSYYPSNDQSVLFPHQYSSPKPDYLPPLSRLLTDNTTTNSTVPTTNASATTSNMIKNEQMMQGVGYYSTQPPSTILGDSPLTSVDLFTPSNTTATDITNDPSNMLTTAPQSIPDTTSMYTNDPITATAAAAATISTNILYGPNGSSTLSTSSMDPLLSTTPATTLDGNTMIPTTLPPTSVPFIYSNPPPMYDSNSTQGQGRHRQASISSNSSADKAYSFVSIPGMNQRKRPRRRYDEIERLYHCTYSGCKKSYGTLNHLNSHVLMQNHGPKRHPSEFKEMRKEWRRQRKQREEQRKQAEKSNKQQQVLQQQQQQQQFLQQHQQPPPPPSTLTAAFQPSSTYIPTDFPLQPMPLSGFY